MQEVILKRQQASLGPVNHPRRSPTPSLKSCPYWQIWRCNIFRCGWLKTVVRVFPWQLAAEGAHGARLGHSRALCSMWARVGWIHVRRDRRPSMRDWQALAPSRRGAEQEAQETNEGRPPQCPLGRTWGVTKRNRARWNASSFCVSSSRGAYTCITMVWTVSQPHSCL